MKRQFLPYHKAPSSHFCSFAEDLVPSSVLSTSLLANSTSTDYSRKRLHPRSTLTNDSHATPDPESLTKTKTRCTPETLNDDTTNPSSPLPPHCQCICSGTSWSPPFSVLHPSLHPLLHFLPHPTQIPHHIIQTMSCQVPQFPLALYHACPRFPTLTQADHPLSLNVRGHKTKSHHTCTGHLYEFLPSP